MAKTDVISARIDPELKREAEQVLEKLGLTASQAITVFYKQVKLQQGLPFIVKIPNEATEKALEDARTRRGLNDFENVDALYRDLGI
jgi:DNA-damage-inducible protein J